ncbi:MAG: FG-GAP-like repeat-containing protein [bacterium]
MRLLKQVVVIVGMLGFMVGDSFGVWPFNAAGNTFLCSPAVSDLTNVGPGSEIVIGNSNSFIYCLSSTGTLLYAFGEPNGNEPLHPVIADINNDNVPEVLFNSSGNTTNAGIYCLDNTLAQLGNSIPTGQNYARGGLTVAYVSNGDIFPKVLAGGNNGLHCASWDGTNSLQQDWVFPTTTHATSPAVADIDEDGDMEIIFGSGRTVYCLNGSGGQKHTWMAVLPTPMMGAVAIADVDGDLKPEILVSDGVHGGDENVLYCLEWNTGLSSLRERWRFIHTPSGTNSAETMSMVAIADLNEADDQSKPEIVVFSNTSFDNMEDMLFVLRDNGPSVQPTIYRQVNVIDGTTGSAPAPVICDIDKDGIKEIIWEGTNALYAYDVIRGGTGGMDIIDNTFTSRTGWEHPAVADINNDGHAEIVAISNNTGVDILTSSSWASCRDQFSCYSYHISNINNDLGVPKLEPKSWEYHNTWLTQVSFDTLSRYGWFDQQAPINTNQIVRSVNGHWAVGDNGLVLGRNTDFSWSDKSSSLSSAGINPADWDFQGVCEIPNSPNNTIFIVGVNKQVSVNEAYGAISSQPRGIILRSLNGGSSWDCINSTSLVSSSIPYNLTFFCVDFADVNNGYIGASEGYVLKTNNGSNLGGATWAAVQQPVPYAINGDIKTLSDCVRSIWVDKANYQYVWVTMDNQGRDETMTTKNTGIARTTDGGATWNRMDATNAWTLFENEEPSHPDGWSVADWDFGNGTPVEWYDVRHANFGISGKENDPATSWIGISTGSVGKYSSPSWAKENIDEIISGRAMFPTWIMNVWHENLGIEGRRFYVGTSDVIYNAEGPTREYFLKNDDLYSIYCKGNIGWMSWAGGRHPVPAGSYETGTLLGRYYAPSLGKVFVFSDDQKVRISWITEKESWLDISSGASDIIDHYEVWRSVCEEGPYHCLTNNITPSNAEPNYNYYTYLDDKVIWDTPYYYKIKIVWKDNSVSLLRRPVLETRAFKATPYNLPWVSVPAPNVPMFLVALGEHGEESKDVLTWQTTASMKYWIYRSEISQNGPFEYIDELSGTGGSVYYKDKTGEIGRTYFYRIRAVDDNNPSDLCDDMPSDFSNYNTTLAVNNAIPPRVTNLKGQSQTLTSPNQKIYRLVWDPIPFTGASSSAYEPYLGGYWVCPIGRMVGQKATANYYLQSFAPIQRTWYEYLEKNPFHQDITFFVCAMHRSGQMGPWSLKKTVSKYKKLYYADCTNGSDMNPGTEGQPFATIQKAASVLKADEAVAVREGVYHETITPYNSGYPDSGIIAYIAVPGERVVITGDNSRDYGFNVNGKSYISICGFEIKDCNEAGILYSNAPHGELWGNTIHHNETGIKAENSSLMGRENTIIANDIGVSTNSAIGFNFGNINCQSAEYTPGNNSIYSNATWNFLNQAGDNILTQNNYWGINDSATIASTVSGPITFMPIKTILPLDWKVQVKATASFGNDTSNYAGVIGEASDSCDEGYDIPKYSIPPSNYVYLYFPHSEWNHPLGDKFCQDVRKTLDLTDSTMVWNFEVNTDKSNENITLNILPSDVPSGYGIYLLDLGNGATQNLRTNPNYVYNSGAGGVRHFQLSVGLGGTNHGGADWVWTTDSTRLVSGRHYNIGLFKINSGATMNSVAFNGTDSTTGIIDVEAQTMQLLGTLSSTGKGNPKASGPGKGSNGTNGAGAGGGACCGQGGLGETEISGGVAYSDTLSPMSYLGCGGGNGSSYSAWGGAGGGRIKLSTATLTLSGKIESNGTDGEAGGSSYAGGGGGAGSIYIICDSISGSGIAETNGGDGAYRSTAQGGGGGAGYLRINYRNSSFSGKLLANGGVGAGSIYPDRAQDGQSGIIKVVQSNGSVELLVSPVNTIIGSHDRLSFVNGANFSNVKFQLDSGDSLLGNASITANEITVSSGAVISADKKGYLTSNGTGKGTNGVNGAGAGGAGYGNTGGNGESGISGGVAYGEADSLNPTSLGSGGGFGDNYTVAPGGSGGGRLKLSANVITIDGIVSANGEAGYKYSSGYAGGAGSGGSIFISCDSLKGEGNIEANGNDGANNTQADGGGSAGGRIALIRNVETFTGNVLVTHGVGPDNATDGGDGKICRGELGSGGPQGTISKPLVFKLYQNYPNPFRNKTTIQYSLPKTSKVSLKLYDLTGRCVKTLVEGERLPGYYKETLESKNYPTGIYFAKFNAGEYKETKKLILMK